MDSGSNGVACAYTPRTPRTGVNGDRAAPGFMPNAAVPDHATGRLCGTNVNTS